MSFAASLAAKTSNWDRYEINGEVGLCSCRGRASPHRHSVSWLEKVNPSDVTGALTRMIVGTGIDIAETDRFQQGLEKHGERFVRRVFTPGEIEYCEQFKKRAERYAARFAAKEAAFKALGTGWTQGVRWLDVEVVHLPSGKPELILTGKALEVARGLRVSRMSVSLSHADRYVVASVIFESDD